MKKILLISLFAFSTFALFAQQQEVRDLPNFIEIHASEGIEVTLEKGKSPRAVVTADNIALEYVITEVSGKELRIRLDGTRFKNADVEVVVTYVELKGLKASSAAEIEGKEKIVCYGKFNIEVSSAAEMDVYVESDELNASVSSAASLDLKMITGRFNCNASSAAKIELSGNAGFVEAEASSAANIDGDELKCDIAELSVSSAGSISLDVRNKIVPKASSGGSIDYFGDPEVVNKQVSSGGSVRKR
jgi:hypothetical protein